MYSLLYITCYMKRLGNEDCNTDIKRKKRYKESFFYCFSIPFLYNARVKPLVIDLSLSGVMEIY